MKTESRLEQRRREKAVCRQSCELQFHVPHDHPKAETLFELAWDHGHSAGLAEVATYYGEFAELIS